MNHQLHTDEELLRLLGQSDTKAFNEIYERYWTVVFRYAVDKVQTQQVAEDLCQDVFVSLWQRRGAVEIKNVEAYLVQATKYGVLNYIRAKMQNRRHLQAAKANPYVENEIESTAALRMLMEAWERCVAELPEKTQAVFRLSKEQDLTNKEIAALLDLSEKTVEYHITKSHKLIRLQLRDFALFLTGALLTLCR